MLLGNASRGRIVARTVRRAPNGVRRLFALRSLDLGDTAVRFAGNAFWVPLRRPSIDVVFLDRSGRVIAIVGNLRAWRGAGPFAEAVEAVALAAGSAERVPIRVGDLLEYAPHTSERVAAGAGPPEHF